MTTMRLVVGCALAMAVAAVGAVIFEAIGIGGWAWYGLATVAILCGTLPDRERFYGTGKTRSAPH
jgi:hypothetical protein